MPSSPAAPGAPGILCYDPNPTTAKLATASLRLGGYQVFNAATKDEAIGLCTEHGPGGDGAIAALLLDASADPKVSAAVLRGLVQLPGASDLPGILMVSRKNPRPIPGAESLPTVRRPFTSPALLKIVSETMTAHRGLGATPRNEEPQGGERESRLGELLTRHFPSADFDEVSVAQLLAELDGAEELPSPAGDESMQASLGATRLEALLDMLDTTGSTGVLTVEDPNLERRGKLHVQSGRIRLAEYSGPDEDLKLGRFVVEGGFMRDDELEAFIIGRDPQGRPLGQRLVDGGFLTETDLVQVLVAQAREITCHVLTFTEGRCSFRPTTQLHPLAKSAADADDKGELLIAEALLDGLRRLDEAAVMGPHMPDVEDIYIRLDEQVVKLGRDSLDREELGVLELINGRNSVKEIARRTRTGTFSVARVLYRLVKSNVVRRRVTPALV